MDGSLTTWFNGAPVVTETDTGDMGTWYNGTTYTYLEFVTTPSGEVTWIPRIIFID